MNFIAKDSGAVAIFTDKLYYWSYKINLKRNQIASFSKYKNYLSNLKLIVTNNTRPNGIDADLNYYKAHSDILFLQYTSGSTSDPKGVMVSHDNILHNCDIVVNHIPIGVSWLPQYHDMGLIGYYLFFALKGGSTYGFSPMDFIQRPSLWLETISKDRGTASSAPNFSYEYCLRPGKIPDATLGKLDLSSLKFLMSMLD